MAEVEWSPAELDRLEDALEDLELEGTLERWLEDEPSPRVRECLEDYRALLLASREALPLEEVPAGLLDGVLAEAQRAARVAPAVVVRESWWARWRRSLMVPALALAGTAALVLWIGRPTDEAALADPTPRTPTAERTRTVKLSFDEEPEAEEVDARSHVAEPAAAPPPPKEARSEAEGTEEQLVQPTEIPALEPLGDAPGQAPELGAELKKDEPARPAGPASGRWDIVSRGDRARQAGDCATARQEYSLALEDDEARVRARAFAGIGLCDRQAGDEPAADANLERARELDAEIDGFLDSQQQSKRNTKKRKAKPKSKSRLDTQATDPFG
ncbi:MAG: hypothetical protein KDK70_01220 [Myxococcales bacterium]|nr:hypothetical protein [Myxococcales bacterium]